MNDDAADMPHDARDRLDLLMPDLYDELRRIAASQLDRERTGHTIQTTALVHEAYLRLVRQTQVAWEDENEIRRAAVTFMRRILVDYARRRRAQKRQAEGVRISLSDLSPDRKLDRDADPVALDEALAELSEFDPRQASIVELRYFGGMTLQETAQNCGISLATVKREWAVARAWLYRRLQEA